MRRFRREFWLWVMSIALGRTLLNCRMPDDAALVTRIRDTADSWRQP